MNVRVDMSLHADGKLHGKAVLTTLRAFEADPTPENLRAHHAALRGMATAFAGHMGVTAGELLDDPSIDSGGTKEPEA